MKRANDREKLDEMRPLKKRCSILPAVGLGVSPSYKNPPPINSSSAMLLLLQKSDEMGHFLPCSGAPIQGRQRRSISI